MSDGMTEFGKALEHIRRCLFWDFAGDRLLNELQTPLGRDYFDRLMEGLTEAHDADVAKYDAENAKLRELAKRMFDRVNYECHCCSIFCSDWDEDNECCVFATSMRELGIEVD